MPRYLGRALNFAPYNTDTADGFFTIEMKMDTMVQPSIRVLHIDDEPEFGDMTATFLERENDRFTVETATSADEGLEIIKDRPPDCVVSDYDMPGKDGIEFLKEVREEYPELPFILFTGKGSEEVASEAISAGVTDYLQKGTVTEKYELLANRVENAVTAYRSQQTAEKRKERLALFFQESPLGVIQWNEDGEFERLNERAEQILGYTEEELRGEPWETVVTEDERDRVRDIFKELFSVGGKEEAINRNVRKDGEVRTCEWHNHALTDADGEVRTIFSKFQDITGREGRKTELEEYETIIESLGDAVYVIDAEGRFRYVNDEFLELVGYERDTVIGNKPSLIKNEEMVKKAERQLGQLLSDDGPDMAVFEGWIHPKDGEPVVCEDHMGVLPYEGDEFEGSVGTLRDITGRKGRERELERYEAMVENTTELITLIDEDGTILYQSPAAERALGYDPGAAVGNSVFEFVHPEDENWGKEELNEFLENPDEKVQGNEYRFLGADGEYVWLEGMFVDGRDTELDGVLVVARDITDRKEREKEIEQKNERLEEFASIVSHDLRSPLSVAKGRLELVQEDCDSEHLDTVTEAHDRMEALIEDTLTLAREGTQASDREPVELGGFVRNCWENTETEEARLVVEDEVTVEAERGSLKQLCENLLRNAVKHGREDVTVTVGELDGREGFYVADDGEGIPEGEREEVFERGYSTSENGTGFGLSIVEEIVEAHGWEIQAVEGDEGGARFEVTGVETVE